MNTVLFTHDDMDGIGCKLIFELAASTVRPVTTDTFESIVCGNYNVDSNVRNWIESNKDITSHTKFIFSDICPSNEVAELLKDMTDIGTLSSVMVYDHHVTNQWITGIFPDAIVTPTNNLGVMECGTSLIYYDLSNMLDQYYDMKFISLLVDTIRSYDTYEWKETNNIMAKKLNLLFTMIGGDNFYQKYYDRITSGNTSDDLIEPNDLIFVNCKFDFEQRVINNMTIDDVIDVDVRGYRVALMIKSIAANISEVSYQFLERYPEFDAFIQFSLFGGGSFSYRTRRSDLNVGEVFAEPLGGGGHPKASGSSLPGYIKDALQDIITKHLNGAEMQINVLTGDAFNFDVTGFYPRGLLGE